MSEWIQQLFANIFGSNSWLATLIISMIPIVELRGAIPFGASVSFWKENALSLWASFGISLAGSTLVCIILTFAFFPLFNWLKRTKGFKKLANFIERKLNKNSKNIDKKTQNEKNQKRALWLKIIGVFGFVALPLPLTGVWTGTCLALFIGLNKWQTMTTVISGNLVAGLLMTLISFLFKGNTSIVLYAFLILVAVFILVEIIKSLIVRAKNKKKEKTSNEETKNVTEVQDKNDVESQTKIEKSDYEKSTGETEKISTKAGEEKPKKQKSNELHF